MLLGTLMNACFMSLNPHDIMHGWRYYCAHFTTECKSFASLQWNVACHTYCKLAPDIPAPRVHTLYNSTLWGWVRPLNTWKRGRDLQLSLGSPLIKGVINLNTYGQSGKHFIREPRGQRTSEQQQKPSLKKEIAVIWKEPHDRKCQVASGSWGHSLTTTENSLLPTTRELWQG